MESISELVETQRRSSDGWVLPQNRKKNKWKRLFTSFGAGFKLYCDNSTLVGYKYITEVQRPWFERIFWVIIHLTTLCIVGYLISSMIQAFVERPVQTAVSTENFPLTEIEFPAIAICNINRISKGKARELAEKLMDSKVVDGNVDRILDLLMHLGNLYETPFDINSTENDLVDKMLQKYYNTDYDITETMKMLTPTCEEGLHSCKLWNETKKCSEIFSFRKTQNGYCCTFNYARQSDNSSNSDSEAKRYINPGAGQVTGLTVVLWPHLTDYFFPFLPTSGFKVTIFNPGDYPDNTSGGVSEILIAPETEAFIKLDASTFFSTEAVRQVDLQSRKCLFSDESTVLSTGYTYSDCLVDCRVSAIWDLCKCRPFYLPKRGNEQYSKNVCNTGHVECLQKHKRKLWSVILQGNYEVDKRGESLNCNKCYPACDDVKYSLEISSVNLEFEAVEYTDITKNSSILHIYFPKFGTIRLKQDIGYYWYELLNTYAVLERYRCPNIKYELSLEERELGPKNLGHLTQSARPSRSIKFGDIGGTCGVFVGFSLISVVEFSYIICRAIWDAVFKCRRKRIPQLPQHVEDNHHTASIYWSELIFYSESNFQSGILRPRPKLRRY